MDFGIYIHFPLCRRRCGYCDFATVRHADFPHHAYADRVLAEAGLRARDFMPWPLRSIYFGGGSPSLWPPSEVGRVVAALRSMFDSAPDGVEITIECNPQDVGKVELGSFHAAGVNRLSVGVQSFDDEMLRRLTREHDSEGAERCIADARSVGFANLNLDLIFGILGQTLPHHLAQLERLVAHDPEHVSVYSLTLGPDALLRQKGEDVVNDDTSAEMLEATIEALATADYAHYEVSNFARRGQTSAHNEGVWRGRPYLGLGASAHSLLWEGRHNVRSANPAYASYMTASLRALAPIRHVEGAEIETLSVAISQYETLMLNMRTQRGGSESEYQDRFGVPIEAHFGEALRELQAAGLIMQSAGAWSPTPRGMLFADSVALRLASLSSNDRAC